MMDLINQLLKNHNFGESRGKKYKLLDIWEKIYEHIPLPEPKFKVGERCIRMYVN